MNEDQGKMQKKARWQPPDVAHHPRATQRAPVKRTEGTQPDNLPEEKPKKRRKEK
jgi:hypothetical protein